MTLDVKLSGTRTISCPSDRKKNGARPGTNVKKKNLFPKLSGRHQKLTIKVVCCNLFINQELTINIL